MEHLEICEYIVLTLPIYLTSFSNPVRHNGINLVSYVIEYTYRAAAMIILW